MTVFKADGDLRRPMTAEEIALAEANQPAPLTLPGKIKIFKADIFRAMTDEEFETFMLIKASFPPRQAAIFDHASYLTTTDEFFPLVLAAAIDAYGEERAAVLLTPTE